MRVYVGLGSISFSPTIYNQHKETHALQGCWPVTPKLTFSARSKPGSSSLWPVVSDLGPLVATQR